MTVHQTATYILSRVNHSNLLLDVGYTAVVSLSLIQSTRFLYATATIYLGLSACALSVLGICQSVMLCSRMGFRACQKSSQRPLANGSTSSLQSLPALRFDPALLAELHHVRLRLSMPAFWGFMLASMPLLAACCLNYARVSSTFVAKV